MLRRAGADDASRISLLGRVTFEQAFGHLFERPVLERYLSQTFDAEKIAASVKKPNNLYYFIEDADVSVGYFKLKYASACPIKAVDAMLQLQKIYLLKEHVGKQLGQAVMREIFSLMREEKSIWLAVVEQNIAARRFYEKQGFIARGKIPHDFEHQRFMFDVMVWDR